MDESFSARTVRGEGFSGKLDDLVTYVIVTYNDDTYIASDDNVTYIKCLQATVTFSLKFREVNIIMYT